MNALRASSIKQILSFGGGTKWGVPVLVVAGMALASLPAQAAHTGSPGHQAHKGAKDSVATVAVKDPEETGSIQSNADAIPGCNRSRKRLFVEGEGWIVRRVTVCY